ncbi:MAG: tRNA lysidine(34) synthetase TilS [Pseudomonadota bacterium]|nr:MAG: tRNA lysidine(34) synthetase TilS [Pseudomonadota bacterium]
MPDLDPAIAQLPGDGRLLVAFSGGPDSLCLLDQLIAAGSDRAIVCVHVDHGQDHDSRQRAERAGQLADSLGVNCQQIAVRVTPAQGPEADARSARYEALQSLMQPGDALLTAHHRDDQVETVLLRMLRGAGPAGLAGIPRQRRFGPGWLVRPLLDWSRSDIDACLAARRLAGLDDPANADSTLDRNFLRQTVLPQLRQRWPGIDGALLRTATLSSGAAALVAQAIDQTLNAETTCRDGLSLAPEVTRTVYGLGETIRHWCMQHHVAPPPGKRLACYAEQVLTAPRDRQPELRWGACVMRRWRDRLWLDRADSPVIDAPLRWDGSSPLQLPAASGWLELRPPPARGLALTVTGPDPGERITLAERSGSRAVGQLLAEHGVPPWRRALWPRIYRNDQLVALGDRFIEAGFATALSERDCRLCWHRSAPGSGAGPHPSSGNH